MVKYTSFKDIPRFISHGNYAVDVGVQDTAIILTASLVTKSPSSNPFSLRTIRNAMNCGRLLWNKLRQHIFLCLRLALHLKKPEVYCLTV